MPSTAKNINTNAVMYTKDMTIIEDFGWCTAVYEHFRSSVSAYHKTLKTLAMHPPEKKKSRVVPGCTIMLLVSIQLYFSLPNKMANATGFYCDTLNFVAIYRFSATTVVFCCLRVTCCHQNFSVAIKIVIVATR
ncbi:hypothetical protein PVAP13_2KG215782 [Panicum virgatum]|uniref:Uncharacterized protein n=1 Tax=Panicum virgatum TaxID=38727 RepID=A0A8T0WBL9_PANVG|nr:hypothetical protein PVAP13_2KG215782 [Panicum virgatum]